MIVDYQLSLSIVNIGRCECDHIYFYAVVIIYLSLFKKKNVKLNDETQPTSTMLFIDPHSYTHPHINNTLFFRE